MKIIPDKKQRKTLISEMFCILIMVLLFALSAPAQQFELQQVLHCPEQIDGAEFGIVMAVDDDDALIYAKNMKDYEHSSIYFYYRDPQQSSWGYLQRITHCLINGAQNGFALSNHLALIPTDNYCHLYGRVAAKQNGWQILQSILPPAGMRFAWSGDIDNDLIILAAQQSRDGVNYFNAYIKEVALVYHFDQLSNQITLLDTLTLPENPWVHDYYKPGFGYVV